MPKCTIRLYRNVRIGSCLMNWTTLTFRVLKSRARPNTMMRQRNLIQMISSHKRSSTTPISTLLYLASSIERFKKHRLRPCVSANWLSMKKVVRRLRRSKIRHCTSMDKHKWTWLTPRKSNLNWYSKAKKNNQTWGGIIEARHRWS